MIVKPPTPASDTQTPAGIDADLEAARPDLEALLDEASSSVDLARQRERIRARLATPGSRVLAFPSRPAAASRRPRPAVRWLAGSAAAGLLIGVMAGHYLVPPFGPGTGSDGVRIGRSGAPRWPSTRPADHAQDEDFLVEMETVLNDRRVAELRALDHLTPVIVLDRSR